MRKFLLIIFLLVDVHGYVIFSQTQTNTTGSDIAADAPYRLKKVNESEGINSVPLHIYVHYCSCFGCNNNLTDIKAWLKNAPDQNFTNLLTFDNYSVPSFDSLITSRSVADATWSVRGFNSSGYDKDNQSTIRFTSDQNIFGTHYVDINQDFWYFTLKIPAEKLVSLDDIFDIKVNFSLNLETDQQQYFRVFRSAYDLPKLSGWYQGDTHYHTIFTQNDVEFGLPLEGTKEAAKKTGMDWITTTNHRCDFDNYGSSMQDNWSRLGAWVQSLNNADSSFIFIRAMEAGLNNGAGDVVHTLLYSSPSDPFYYSYFLDGGGDISSTSNTILQALTNLTAYKGFCYAAHPFAEKDDLGFFIGGSVWNLNDPLFPADGSPYPTIVTVKCNDLTEPIDVYSNDTSCFFKKGLMGGEIWHDRNSMTTTDEENDAWNVTNSSSVTPLTPMDTNNSSQHFYRFTQGLDIADFLQKKLLEVKNNRASVKNWKFFIAAGRDAHGSFNYSKTKFTGVLGAINDNALGKMNTLAYCPQGMGHNGFNILKALHNGNTILSDGPLVNIGISTDGNDFTNEIPIGQNKVLAADQIAGASLVVDSCNTPEFGDVNAITLTGITQDSIYHYDLPVVAHQAFNLPDILNDLFGLVPEGQYFMIRASLRTTKNYETLSTIYRRTYDRFFSITNPIWLKSNTVTGVDENPYPEKIVLRPNPVYDRFFINLPDNENYQVMISDMDRRMVFFGQYTSSGIDVKI